MALNKLSDRENYLLMQLSYYDLPTDFSPNNTPIEAVLKKMEKLIPAEQLDYFRENISKEIEKSPNLMNIRMTGYENNNPTANNNVPNKTNSGFVGYAFTDENRNSAAIYRGSEDMGTKEHFLTDWISNAEASLGISIDQHKEAANFYDKYIHNTPGEKIILGHSKGGNLAMDVFVKNLQDNPSAYVVNGQPIYIGTLNPIQIDALQSEKLTFIRQDGDPVSLLGAAPYIDRIIRVDPKKGDGLFGRHMLDAAIFDSRGSLVIEDHPLSNITLSNFGGVTIGVLLNTVINTFNGAINPIYAFNVVLGNTLPFMKAVAKGVMNIAEKFKNACIQVFESVKQKAGEVVTTLYNWFDGAKAFVTGTLQQIGNWISQINSIVVEPYLSVNTARLNYYAQRLAAIQRQIVNIDDKLHGLYFKVGLLELGHLIKADFSTGYEEQLSKCISYLSNTAQLLENAETRLVRRANSI